MRNFWLTLLMVGVVGAVSYGAFFALNDNPAIRHAARDRDAMAWLKAEFRLDDAQFAAIRQLHDRYGVVCAQHCRAITDARRRNAPPQEVASLERLCVDSMSDHFHRVAALMPPGEGQRYLAIVLPRISGYAHDGAPNVQVQP